MNPTTKARIDRLVRAVHKAHPETRGDELSILRTEAELVLREQDRDSRHACTDAVIPLMVDHRFAINLPERITNACLNIKAV